MLMALILTASLASGHGLGEQKLERVESGPFRISAWVDPIEPTTDDEVHITVALEDNEGLVRNADITVQMVYSDDTDITFTERATHEQAVNKLHYEAPFIVENAGEYSVTVAVENGDRNGEASFSMTINAGDGMNVPVGWVAAGIAGALVMTLVVWNRVQLARADEKK